ncbi:hypothetical protein CAPTEDRAFT_106307 [Capitella teleta]|uniref:N(6)-L-threonylcarbamoyladenine synthase n=1 Tax=Capitella teleta TaxID=283909 RepID=R7VLR5_CAPTE|nr:hypothetical protein CAPTEDRAFT_106307 [Capitella teleta]|eukprot:ELU17835.1 hypothetical protein CAPTEDRAFT_106307 [Capitella teleta]
MYRSLKLSKLKYRRFLPQIGILTPFNWPDTINQYVSSFSAIKTRRQASKRLSNLNVALSSPLWAIKEGCCCRDLSSAGPKQPVVLGIETSCDDTGAAVVNADGEILGEDLNSQTDFHVQFGGIYPNKAGELHSKHISSVVDNALSRAGFMLNDVDAIATTVMPGLAPCLGVGLDYTKQLLRISRKPFIPIHHMEAHALTARMLTEISFPFLVLLVSGGNCLLALARDVDDFLLLGKSLDKAPGDAYDKIARRLNLKDLAACEDMCGGRAVEVMALSGDPLAFPLHHVMSQKISCDFSFSGLQTSFMELIQREEKRHSGALPEQITADICASFQYNILHHLVKRVRRAFLFCEKAGLMPENIVKTLVVSGGVASNQFLRNGMSIASGVHGYQMVCPPPHLCTDNGIMIAWNGVEKYKVGRGFVEDFESVIYEYK